MSERPDTFCRYEAMSFPGDEFTVDPEWGRVHEAEPRHTVMGSVIGEEYEFPTLVLR